MESDNLNLKEVVIKEFVNSGINLTPSILEILLKLDAPLEKVKLIIKNISFLPSFDSHLTIDVLRKISNPEIEKALNQVLIKEIQSKTIQNQHLKEKLYAASLNSNEEVEITEAKPQTSDGFKNVKKLNIQQENQENSFVVDETSKKSPLGIQKDKTRTTPYQSSRSTLKFKPSAKEYDFNYKILKDPTDKLYTNGTYEDFYNLTLDKFNKLRELIKKRPEVHSANNINNILRLTNKVEISVIGMIYDIHKTKNGNFFLTLEDLTNSINVIIKNDSENQENVKIAERCLNDQMIYVEGTYNPGDNRKGGIVYGNYISKIDIPRDYQPNMSISPLSIALISDTHIGSKEFEEHLWNRFIDFLNGKIGNKKQKEIAGRIKYLIINGDLVDGIGVYPNQKSDLIITDIYKQFEKAKEILSGVPEYIKIFYSSGNHEPVRNAIPRPAVPKKYSAELIDNGVLCIGNPSLIQTHNVNTLVFHGDSLLDLNMLIHGLDNNKPIDTMVELLKCRHLAPVYGKKTQIAPTSNDWLVIDKIPDIFHTGHIHINGMDYYNNISLVNSGCFQTQTEFMNSLGIHPTPGILSIVDLDTLKGTQLDLKSSV
ncbi:MAG: metallophosphoesterase [Candidatus Hermodarchaeota archaeon]